MKLVLLIFLTFLYCCIYSQEKLDSTTIKAIDNLKNEFKGVFFVKCIQEGYNHSNEIKSVLDNDPSFKSDFKFGNKNYQYLDSLAKTINKALEKDSIESFKQWNSKSGEFDFLIGKRVLSICLEYYNSKDLDSIAHKKVYDLKHLYKY